VISVRVSEKHSQVTNLEFNSTVTLASPLIKTCKHLWIIEMARGRYSKGYCEYCGEIRMFDNHPVDITQVSQFENRLYSCKLSAFEKMLKMNWYDLLGDSR
jgi:hypothetical protein